MQADRRVFIATVAALAGLGQRAAAQGGLEAFGGASLPCAADVTATPAVPRAAGYRPGAPMRQSLIEPGSPGPRLILTGVVAGLSCGPISGALLEFWHADARGRYSDKGFELCGRQRTDEAGRYRLVTVLPGAPPNEAPHIGVHVIVAGKAELWTAIFFRGNPANARDPRAAGALLATLDGTADARSATFDIRLDL